MKTISAAKAKKLVTRGAVVIDIREPGEFARGHIPGARNEPASRLGRLALKPSENVVIWHCKSGMRTRIHAAKLEAAADCDAYVLDGGIDAWKAASLPVEAAPGASEAQHQLQIVGLSIVFIGVALGMSVQPVFYGLALLAAGWLVYGLIKGRRG